MQPGSAKRSVSGLFKRGFSLLTFSPLFFDPAALITTHPLTLVCNFIG